jgi:anti-sigma-K factor RskA
MSEHEQYAEDLALYALDALRGKDRARVDEHLTACSACRRELEQLRGDTALLALSTTGPRPPQRARQRLLDAVAREPRVPHLVQTSTRGSWWGWLGWAATAAVVIFAVSLWRENLALKSALTKDLLDLRAMQSQHQLELGQANDVVAALTTSDAMRVTLVAAKALPQPQGKVFYLRNRGSLVLLANNLPALPPQKAYELWLIPTSGAPVPAGVFKPDAHGSASVVNPPLLAGAEAKTFAITVENETGATTPTMPIVMMGTGE